MRKTFWIILLAVSLLHACTIKAPRSIELNQWQFDYQDQWYEAHVPGCIHTDLMANNLIDDPYYGTNEDSLQWVSDSEWVYITRIDNAALRTMMDDFNHVELVFDGLQTYGTVWFNDTMVLKAYNMFRQWRIDISENMLTGDSSTIKVLFRPTHYYNEWVAQQMPYPYPELRAISRSAPYQEGWDWGPKLATCGICKPARIEGWNNIRMSNSWIRCTDGKATAYAVVMSDKDAEATLAVRTVNGNTQHTYHQKTKVALHQGENIITLDLNDEYADTAVYHSLIAIHLPHHDKQYGESDFYNIHRSPDLSSADTNTLVFYHDMPFVKGANWIPLHTFPYGTSHEARYRQLLTAAKEQGCNMIRIWGGGIYEDDCFFAICDELGIKVWVDFVFAGSFYPGDDDFLENVKAEAEEQVRRLARFSCITLWCGNNEVKNGWEDWGWQKQYGYPDSLQQQIQHNIDRLFGFDGILHNAVKKYMPDQFPYWPSSPLWGWGHKECDSVGDSHYWGVWWGELPFEIYREHVGPFMSEYGYQSYPQMSTLEAICPDSLLFIGSPVLNSHQKHGRGVEIITNAIRTYYGIDAAKLPLDQFVYYSQILQSYGMGIGVEAHLMRSPHCYGTLYWQFNDSWPVASWSCIDYYGNRKPFFFKAQQLFRPDAILVEPAIEGEITPKEPTSYGTFYHRYSARSVRIRNLDHSGAPLKLKVLDFQGKEIYSDEHRESDFLFTLPDGADTTQCYLLLENPTHSRRFFFARPSHLKLSEVPYSIVWTGGSQPTVTIEAQGLMKDVVVVAQRHNPQPGQSRYLHGNFSNNGFDIDAHSKVSLTFSPAEKTADSIVFSLHYYAGKQ